MLCLVTLAFAAPLLVRPARAYGEHVFQASPVVGSGDPYYAVYAGTTLAESISVTQSYTLTNVTLRVRNDGGTMNALVVSIHPDDPVRHVPVLSTPLASSSWVTPDNATSAINWSFPFNPSPVLQAGSVYWIVAENNAPQGPPTNGYEWHESDADVYPNGSAFAFDTGSGVWTGLPYDLYFVTYGRERSSNLTLAMTADRQEVAPADRVTFTVDFNNTGTDSAPWAWVNTTLTAEFTNISAAFPGIQPISAAAFPNLTFQNVTNGPHSFTVSAQVAIGIAPGTILTAGASLDFQNATGTVARGQQASTSLTVGLVTKQLYLGSTSVATKLLTTTKPTGTVAATTTLTPGAAQPVDFVLAPALATSFQGLNATASLWVSTQKNSPQTYHLNLSLLDNGTTVASAYPSFSLTPGTYHLVNWTIAGIPYPFASGHKIGLSLWSLGGGSGSTDNLLVRYNATAYPSSLNLVTSTYVSIDHLLLEDPVSNATVWSPFDPIVVLANVSDPFGASRIAGVWVNITSPSGSLVAADEMDAVMTDPSGLPAWTLFNYTLAPPLATGQYRIDVEAMEDNGVVDLARGCADVASPSFTLEESTSLGRAQAGGSFAYFLYFNNTGTGAAGSVWVNETLPSEVTYAGSSLPYTSAVGNQFTWALVNVSLGTHLLEVDVSVLGSSVAPAWIQDNATLAYADMSGHLEDPLAAYAVVFLNGPVFTVSLSAAPAAGIHANETLVYTVHIQNGGAVSGAVWMNDTMPTGFSYLSDNAGPLGASLTQSGSRLMYRFLSIPSGANWTVEIDIQAGPEVVGNASYIDVLEINYTSSNGYLMPSERRSVSLVALSPSFSVAEITFLVADASPGGRAPAVIRIWNEGNEAAPRAWVTLALDSRLSIADASGPFSSGLGTAQFSLLNVVRGETTIYLNVSVNPSTVDGVSLQIKGELTAQDGYGNVLPTLVMTRTFILVNAAALALSVDPSQVTVEAGTSAILAVTLDNVGGGDASNAWLNVTIPGTLEYLSDSSGLTPSVVGFVYSYHWGSLAVALWAHAHTTFDLSVAARPATPNGTAADLVFHLDYQDANLRSRTPVNVSVHTRVVAPSLVLRVEASSQAIVAGRTLNYSLVVRNAGATLAHEVSVRDDIDPRLEIVTYTSSVPAEGNQSLVWNFTDLGPGESVSMNVTIRIVGGVPAGTDISNSIVAMYTNSAGALLTSIRSTPVTIQVTEDLTAILWVLGFAGVFGLAVAVLLIRRDHVEIEDAFLVYRDGVLISHLSRSLLREKDEDVLSGMLTAVQEFVREAFQYGQHRDLQQLDFGDYRILIERGRYVYLAVVYSGEESPAIRKKVRTVIALVEKQFGSVLERWDGDMEEVMGARDLIRETLLGTNGHNHTEHATPQYE